VETLITGQVSADGLVQPRIEPEIVVGLKTDLPPRSEPSANAAAIDCVAAGLESSNVTSRGGVSAAEAVAEAGLHTAPAIGRRQEINAQETIALSPCDCEFVRDGTLVHRGLATTAPGGPVPALLGLLKGLPDRLRAGDIITTGSMIDATPVAAGQRWTNQLHGPASSSVEMTFT